MVTILEAFEALSKEGTIYTKLTKNVRKRAFEKPSVDVGFHLEKYPDIRYGQYIFIRSLF